MSRFSILKDCKNLVDEEKQDKKQKLNGAWSNRNTYQILTGSKPVSDNKKSRK